MGHLSINWRATGKLRLFLNQGVGLRDCQLILQEILYQTVITDRRIAAFPTRTKVCKKYRLQFSLWTLHKGGLQYTVVNKYLHSGTVYLTPKLKFL